VPEGITRCAALGATTIIVAPYFINTGLLVERICRQAQEQTALLPGRRIVVAPHLGLHPKLVDLVVQRATEPPCSAAPGSAALVASGGRGAAEPVSVTPCDS